MNKLFKYILLVAAFIVLYGFTITDSLSADSDSEPAVCNTPIEPLSSTPTLLNPGDLLISQVLPNPKGKDQGVEWIELKNATNQDINLLNVVLVINDKKYDLPETIVAPQQKIHALSKDWKITLPNKATTLILQDISGKEIDRLQYPDAKDDVISSHDPKITMETEKTNGSQLKLPTSGNGGGLIAGASATFLARLWLKGRIS